MRSNSEIVDIIISEKDKKGLSLSELARRTGIAKSAMSRYLNKTRQFPLNKAQDFADVLEISVEYLLGYSEEPFDEEYYINKSNEALEELSVQLTGYNEQYNSIKDLLYDKLQDLNNILNEEKIHRKEAITTLLSIKKLVDNFNGVVELITSTKDNYLSSKIFKMMMEDSRDLNKYLKVVNEEMEKLVEELNKLEAENKKLKTEN
ncbi:helix-turn-helix domain-containing protein [Streptococcus sp. SK643]|uniref:helix-turn-helix domain-containing protein n=1 Tax=Streptococcus sp. SK643 TaxID=1095727 RepID=UPI00025B0F17|nr:helix-turn-helix transcriptional regulator [Streptococcus sp. SK643]EIF39951.1 DNA-binding helix-turn-helix protein [Streptococcus sp. SK643]